MPYATVQDLTDRLGTPRMVQLTDLGDERTGVVVQQVAQKAIDDASAEIDGYLVGRYALPLASAPAVLRVYCVSIAHYRLLGSAADDVAQADYKAAVKYLQLVAAGDVPLLPANVAAQPSGAGAVVFVTGSKTFAREA